MRESGTFIRRVTFGVLVAFFSDWLLDRAIGCNVGGRATHERFVVDERENLPVRFSSFCLSKDADWFIIQDQLFSLKRLKYLPQSAFLVA